MSRVNGGEDSGRQRRACDSAGSRDRLLWKEGSLITSSTRPLLYLSELCEACGTSSLARIPAKNPFFPAAAVTRGDRKEGKMISLSCTRLREQRCYLHLALNGSLTPGL